MSSKIQIINLALRRLGEQPINAIDEGSEPANIVSDIYDILLENELRSYAFRWAVTTAELAVIEAEEPPDFGYAFALPADYIKMLRIVSPITGTTLTETEWEVREGKLYSDYDELTIKYIFLEEDTSKWDAHFVNAFGYKLAEEVGLALTGRDDIVASMEAKYMMHISKARQSSGSETRRSHPLSRDYIEARSGLLNNTSNSTDETAIT